MCDCVRILVVLVLSVPLLGTVVNTAQIKAAVRIVRGRPAGLRRLAQPKHHNRHCGTQEDSERFHGNSHSGQRPMKRRAE